MSEKHQAVAEVLIDIEYELRRTRLWQTQAPSARALASTQPFAVDTLDLHQWLQFIFLPKMHQLVEQRADLPEACAIAPMAEEFYKNSEKPVQPLVAQLQRLDGIISQ